MEIKICEELNKTVARVDIVCQEWSRTSSVVRVKSCDEPWTTKISHWSWSWSLSDDGFEERKTEGCMKHEPNGREESETARDWDPRTHEQTARVGTQESVKKTAREGTQEPVKQEHRQQ